MQYNLLLVIETAFASLDPEENVEIILTIHGQLQDKSSMIAFLSETNQHFNIMMIGAGSIQESLCTRRCLLVRTEAEIFCYLNGVLTSVQQFASVSFDDSESDIKYLINLIITSKEKDVYTVAYQNYKDFIKAYKKYLDSHNKGKIFKV